MRNFTSLNRRLPGEEAMNGAIGTVFIVDDEGVVRSALSRLLAAAGYQVRVFDSATRFLEEQDADTPGCLLLDVCLPGLSGIELQGALDGSPRTRPIVFLSGMGDVPTSVKAMKAGAVDFLTKPICSAKLFAAIEQAMKRDAEERLERAIRNAIDQRLKILTRREREVMEQVIRGRLNKQIAADLRTGEKTVKVHRARVMSKLGVRSVPELVQLAMRAGVATAATMHAPARGSPLGHRT
jgi:FixJ family two-component response regulator